MNIIKVDELAQAYHELNLFFTKLTSGDNMTVSHNSFRNDHFLNAFNIVITSLTHHNDLTLEQMSYSKSKITHLLRSYLDPEDFWGWVEQIKAVTEQYEKVDSDIILRTTNNSKHSNGPCLLGISYRSHHTPHLTVYSRSAELPQIFGGDTLLISAIAEIISQQVTQGPIRITWFIASARIKSRSANFYRLLAYPLPIEYLHPEFQKHIDKQWDNILADQSKEVSFSKLVKLQEVYKRVVIEKALPKTETGVPEFIEKMKGGWNI